MPEPQTGPKANKWLTVSAVIGPFVWCGWWCINRPPLAAANWAEAMVLLAALVQVPLGLKLIARQIELQVGARLHSIALWLQFPAALVLVASFVEPMGTTAAVLALPWLAVTVLISVAGIFRLFHRKTSDVGELCTNAGCIYILVGGVWCVVSRAGLRPWDFDALIVLMTAVHFHFAAFVLPILAGRVLKATLPARVAKLAAIMLLSAIPLLAAAITATHFRYSPAIEWFAACWMASAGTLVAGLHIRLAFQSGRPAISRLLWGIAGGSLIFGMAMAALYGLREANVLPRFEIPTMIATHGTINAFGFCLAGLLGWLIAENTRKERKTFVPELQSKVSATAHPTAERGNLQFSAKT